MNSEIMEDQTQVKTEAEGKPQESKIGDSEKRLLQEIFSITQNVDNNIIKLEKDVEDLKNLISYVENLKIEQKAVISELDKNVTDLEEKLKGYKTKLGSLTGVTTATIEQYKAMMASFRDEVIEPYRVIINKIGEKTKEIQEVDNLAKKLYSGIEECKEIGNKLKENPEIISIISKYGRRTTPEEESRWVAELLDKKTETLRYALQMAKELGYNIIAIMPIAAAYGLKNYIFGKGVDESICKEMGIEKNVIEKYIVEAGVNAKDAITLNKILVEMGKR